MSALWSKCISLCVSPHVLAPVCCVQGAVVVVFLFVLFLEFIVGQHKYQYVEQHALTSRLARIRELRWGVGSAVSRSLHKTSLPHLIEHNFEEKRGVKYS